MPAHCSFKSATFRYNKIAYGTAHTRTKQDITKKSHMLQPYSMQEITQQTLLFLPLVVEVGASSISVIWHSSQKLFDSATQ
jgi:hypothetical protein